jgi:putative transposase
VKNWVLEAAGLSRSSYYYRPSGDDQRHTNSGRPVPGYTLNRDGTMVLDTSILAMIRSFRDRVEYANAGGVRKLKYLLRRTYGIYVNEKKVWRICRENRLLLARRRSRGIARRHIAKNRVVTGPNQVWQFDLKFGYVDGENRFFFVLAFIDVFSRKVVGHHIGLSCKGGDLCFVLRSALLREGIESGHLLVIRSDNGTQMTCREFATYLEKLEMSLHHEFIPVQTPNKNAHIESFFSILELEFLRVRYFRTFAEAYEETNKFIRFYNEERIHGSIGYITPAEALEKYKRGEMIKVKPISM